MSVFSPFKHVAQKRIKESECSGATIPGLPHTATFCFQLAGVFTTTSSPAPPLSLKYPSFFFFPGFSLTCNIQEEVHSYSTYLLPLMETGPVGFKWASWAVLHIFRGCLKGVWASDWWWTLNIGGIVVINCYWPSKHRTSQKLWTCIRKPKQDLTSDPFL